MSGLQMDDKLDSYRANLLQSVTHLVNRNLDLMSARVKQSFALVADRIVQDGCNSLWNALSGVANCSSASLPGVVQAAVQQHVDSTLTHLNRCCAGHLTESQLSEARETLEDIGSRIRTRLVAEAKA